MAGSRSAPSSAAATLSTPPAESFEITTVSADPLRAVIRTAGALTGAANALLCSVLHTHLRAGRHYLRVDIGDSPIPETHVLHSLAEMHRHVAARGGMLVF